jgi:hypothetical protein
MRNAMAMLTSHRSLRMQGALDGAPVAEPHAQHLQVGAHVLLLGDGEVATRHHRPPASRRFQNVGSIPTSWIACTTHARLCAQRLEQHLVHLRRGRLGAQEEADGKLIDLADMLAHK